MNNNLMSADEAQRLLATFQRGRERGDAADVWGPLDRLEDALRTVVAREGEVAELRASMPVRDPVTEEEIDVALVWIRQSDCDTSRRAAHTVEQLANDLAVVRGDRASLCRDVARLHEALRAVARACTLPEDTLPAALPRLAGECILDLSMQIVAARDDARDAQDERVLLRAIVAALPTCAECGATATRTCSTVSPSDYCDEHAPAGPWSLADLPHAAAVRTWRGAR